MIRKIVLCATLSMIIISASAQKGKKTTKSNLKNHNDSLSYSLGVSIATNIKNQGIDTVNVNALAQGFTDVYKKNNLTLTAEQANKLIAEFFQEAQHKKAQGNLIKGQKFLEENKTKPGVVTLPSGLQYQVLKEGTGAKPGYNDKVTTHYHGTLIDGTVFDSSVERGQPASFPVNGVIKGWTEALQMMPVGSKWKLFIPPSLAYGERGAGGMIGPNETLIFEVELLSIDK